MYVETQREVKEAEGKKDTESKDAVPEQEGIYLKELSLTQGPVFQLLMSLTWSQLGSRITDTHRSASICP